MTIRPIAGEDRAQWEELYRGYADFYRMPVDSQMLDRLWGWLGDEAHEVEGVVAEESGALTGLAHYSRMVSPLRAGHIGYLHDLFVSPAARGGGIGAALIAEVRRISLDRGWGRVRWLTRDNNYRARGLYDQVAECTDWKVYDISE